MDHGQDSVFNPFGLLSCEQEIKKLRDFCKYRELFVENTRFNQQSLQDERYLIVGRRGSGKTALTQYYHFQHELPNACYIDVDEPKIFLDVLSEDFAKNVEPQIVTIRRFYLVWEMVIWSTIFQYLSLDPDCPSVLRKACVFPVGKDNNFSVVQFIRRGLKEITHKFLGADGSLNALENYLAGDLHSSARKASLKLIAKRPIIIAIDSLEHYETDKPSVLMAISALIEYASDLNVEYASRGLHIKVFVSAEIFPFLVENVITNAEKFVRDPVFLQWRPKELIRLICWRFYKFLEWRQISHRYQEDSIDWESFKDVYAKMWVPFFGDVITNALGIEESTFAYIVRHTQLRPRQLIKLCNSIARCSIRARRFPLFSTDDIREGIRDAEEDMAGEVVNSYNKIQVNVGHIIDALKNLPPAFSGNELDRVAKETAADWQGGYDSLRFRRLVAELGVVGVVRRGSKSSQHVEADFEYFTRYRLHIATTDKCVIHPMFYRRFGTDKKFTDSFRVLPFPDHPEFHELIQVERRS